MIKYNLFVARIPRFRSEKEIREFWDTYRLVDYEEDLKPTRDVVFVKPERQIVSLQLDRKIVRALKSFANSKGIAYSSLIRMWLLEKFNEEIHLKKAH